MSHVVFKHLQPFIHRAIDLDISPVITIDETVLKDTNLLKLIRPVAIYLAVAYAIEDSGVNIDETGVWLENKDHREKPVIDRGNRKPGRTLPGTRLPVHGSSHERSFRGIGKH